MTDIALGINALFQTTKRFVLLHMDTFIKGRRYEFRLSAITKDGTRGYSLPSLSVRSIKSVRRPARPQKLRLKMHLRDSLVDVELRWQQPRFSSPLTGYELRWRKEPKEPIPRKTTKIPLVS